MLAAGLLAATLIVALKPLLVRYAGSPECPVEPQDPDAARRRHRGRRRGADGRGARIHVLDLPDHFLRAFVIVAAAAILLASSALSTTSVPFPPACASPADRPRSRPSCVERPPDPSGLVPLVMEQAFLILGGVWFVNLVNFMDGLDWITVAEMVPMPAPSPISARCVASVEQSPRLSAARSSASPRSTSPSRGSSSAMWVRCPSAFSSAGCCCLGRNGRAPAAILLPLYYLMDATITLLRRLARREKVWEAHRSHFYQRPPTTASRRSRSAPMCSGSTLPSPASPL